MLDLVMHCYFYLLAFLLTRGILVHFKFRYETIKDLETSRDA